MTKISDTPWTYQKCRCGHPSCKQYTLSNQSSVGFSLEDAHLMVASPAMLAALEAAEGVLSSFGDKGNEAAAAVAEMVQKTIVAVTLIPTEGTQS